MLRSLKARIPRWSQSLRSALPYIAALALALLVAGSGAHSAYATSPTATPTIGITIPTNTILSSSNDWISTFAPIAAIGIGISIALAVLGYLGKMIVSAFHA